MTSGGARRPAVLARCALALALAAAGCRPPAPPPAIAAGPARLEVEVRGLASGDGRVGLALFASAASFAAGGEPLRRAFLPIRDGACVWVLDGLPAGDYAAKAFHDVDGDGRLDYGPLGAPAEPYGFSNGARGRFGPPAWSAARFRLEPGGGRISIEVR